MTNYLNAISDAEYQKLKLSIPLITLYIAGADDKIGEDELKWAEKITNIREYSLPDGLNDFYKDVGLDFQEKIDHYMKTLSDLNHRNKTVEAHLGSLNPILAKLEPELGVAFYNSFRSFAKHVAKASGGFLGFFSIGSEEAALLDLKNLTPIVMEEDESESDDQ